MLNRICLCAISLFACLFGLCVGLKSDGGGILLKLGLLNKKNLKKKKRVL